MKYDRGGRGVRTRGWLLTNHGGALRGRGSECEGGRGSAGCRRVWSGGRAGTGLVARDRVWWQWGQQDGDDAKQPAGAGQSRPLASGIHPPPRTQSVLRISLQHSPLTVITSNNNNKQTINSPRSRRIPPPHAAHLGPAVRRSCRRRRPLQVDVAGCCRRRHPLVGGARGEVQAAAQLPFSFLGSQGGT